MYQFTYAAHAWKADWSKYFVDWIYAQPPDPHPELMGPPRRLVLDTSGVCRQVVMDPRFDNADSQLLYGVEQCRVGNLTLSRSELVRLDQLIKGIDQAHPEKTSVTQLREIRALLRKGIGTK